MARALWQAANLLAVALAVVYAASRAHAATDQVDSGCPLPPPPPLPLRHSHSSATASCTCAGLTSHICSPPLQAYWEQQAAAVKAACSLSSFYGEDFYMGARVLSTQMANSVGACCAQCDANPNCDRQVTPMGTRLTALQHADRQHGGDCGSS